MTDAVLSLETLSTTLVRDQFRDGLQTAADGTDPLTDPKATDRSNDGGAPFVMTSFPQRNTYYPHVIVGEGNNELDRIDLRATIQSGTFDIIVDVYAESKTHLFSIRDEVKKWVLDNVEALESVGYSEVRLVGSVDVSWDETSHVLQWRLTYRGFVHVI